MGSPVVGITACRSDLEGRVHHIVQEKYATAVSAAAGALPLLIPALGRAIANDDLLDSIDGLLLTGSPSNVLPRHYGQPGQPARHSARPSPRRDHPAARAPLHRARDAAARGVPRLSGGERRVRRNPAPARPRAAGDARPPQAFGARHRRPVRTVTRGRAYPRRVPPPARRPGVDRGQLAPLAGHRPARRPARGRGAGAGRSHRGGERRSVARRSRSRYSGIRSGTR